MSSSLEGSREFRGRSSRELQSPSGRCAWKEQNLTNIIRLFRFFKMIQNILWCDVHIEVYVSMSYIVPVNAVVRLEGLGEFSRNLISNMKIMWFFSCLCFYPVHLFDAKRKKRPREKTCSREPWQSSAQSRWAHVSIGVGVTGQSLSSSQSSCNHHPNIFLS